MRKLQSAKKKETKEEDMQIESIAKLSNGKNHVLRRLKTKSQLDTF